VCAQQQSGSTVLSRYKSGLIALFERVHRLQADPTGRRLLALEIQEELLLRIGRAERVIRRTRNEIDTLKRRLAQRGNDRGTSRQIKAQRIAADSKIELQREVLAILRAVGDAVAFIYGDRWDLKQLVKHETSGFITGKRGTRFERRALRQVFHSTRDAVAVLNDVTHTLRHGDITVFSPTNWPEGRFGLIELKSGRGGSRSRTARQSEALERVSNYLRTDVRQAEDGSTWRRESIMSHPVHHFDTVARLIAELPRSGSLLREIEPGLEYGVIEYREGYNLSTMAMLDKLKKATHHRRVFFFVNELKYQHGLAYYPFPLCFRDPEVLFRFYNGELLIYVIIDMDRVNELLVSHRLSVRLSDRDFFFWEIVPLADEERSWHISSHMVERLAGEFLRLDWLLENTVIGGLGHDVYRRFREAEVNNLAEPFG
jgi:hypothetical protein